MKIAIACPTRERLNRKLTLINSILTTVEDIRNVNLYLGVDLDDPSREITIKIAQAIPFVKIVHIEPMGKQTNIHKIWNQCIAKSDEEIIAFAGDDFVFRTPNWDRRIINEFDSAPKDGILFIHADDGHQHDRMAVNGFTTRKYLPYVNGEFMSEHFIMNWADQWLHVIFGALGRKKYLADVLIEHQHWIFQSGKPDKVGQLMMDRDTETKALSDAKWGPTEPERVEIVKRIARDIGVKPDFKAGGFSERYWNETLL